MMLKMKRRIRRELKNMPPGLVWSLISFVHAVAVFTLCTNVLDLNSKAGTLIAVCAYALVWLCCPIGWYRRVFVVFKTGWLVRTFGTIQLEAISTFSDSTNIFKAHLQSDWVIHVCCTLIMLSLLVLDYLNRRNKHL